MYIWFQLKKDYIPGYGDTIDLVIIAASWDKDRGRELRGDTIYVLLYTMFLRVFQWHQRPTRHFMWAFWPMLMYCAIM